MAVKIPTYDDRLSPEGFVTPQARATEVSGAIGAGLQNLGNAGMEMAISDAKLARYDAQQLKIKDDADAVANMYKPLSDGQVYWNDYLTKASTGMVDGGNIKDAEGNSIPLREKVQKDFNDWSESFLAGVTNEKAKHLALQHLASMQTQVLDHAMRMQATADVQNRSDKVDETVGNLASEAATGKTDPLYLATMAKSLIANAGFDQHTRNLKALAATKTIVEAAIQGEIKRNPIQTREALIQRFGVDPDAQQSGGAPAAPGAAAAPGPIDFSALWKAQTNQESGGKQFKNGKPVESPKGAVGYAQIMPGTGPEAAKLAGLPWSPQRLYQDESYNDALGQAYMKKQLETFGGDTAKALAAYNMGPGSAEKGNGVAGLVAKYGDQWLSHAPKETQNYVATIMGKVGGMPAAAPAAAPGTTATATAPKVPLPQSLVDLVNQLEPDRLHTFISEAQTESSRQQAVFRSQITTTEGDHVTAFMNGATVAKPLSAADYNNAYGPIEGPQRFANYQQIQQMGTDINGLKLQTPEQMQATVDRYKPDPAKPGYELATKRYDAMLKAADQVNTARQTDPMAYAIQTKIGDAKPLPFNDPAAFGAELGKRVGVANTMQQTYQTPLTLLTKAESTTLNQGFERMTTQQRLGYLSAIKNSVTDPTAYRAVMQQIAPDSPVTAMAGIILSKQNPVVVKHMMSADQVFKQQDVAGIMLEGEALLNPNKLDKSENGKGKTFPLPKEQDMRDQFTAAVGKAFAADPNGANFAYQAAKAYYVGKAARDGDVSGQIDAGRMKDAINAVVGGVTDINGKGEVVRPWGMSEERFTNGAKLAFDTQMIVNGYKGTMLDNWGAYGLQTAGDSKYLVRSGTGYLTDRSGNPLVLDLTEKPSLANQIPGQRPMTPPVTAPATITQDKTAKPNTSQPRTR
jgi:hypothetical protein